MSAIAQPADTVNDRIQLPFNFDVEKIMDEINALNLGNFVYYDSLPLRSPAHIVDPTLPPPPPADDYADGTWTEWLDTPALKSSPYITSVVDFFREKTRVTLVRILRLEPGQIVKEHTDPTLGLQIERSVIRLTIPVLVNDKVEFHLNGTPVPMKPGECWYLRLTDPHKVINHGEEQRINITIDMEPNEWIRSVIEEHDSKAA